MHDMSDSRYSCLSLFTGACGLDVGLERTGRFRLIGCLEFNPVFAETIRRNRDAGRIGHRDMPVFEGDIRAMSPEQVMTACGIAPGELDVLVGGPPCQSFSTTGRRRTVQDPRGELLWDYLRFVVALRPKIFLMENVRGLLSAALRHRPIAGRPDKGGAPLAADEQPGSVIELWANDLVLQTDGEYRVDCFEVNAVNYGAPQLRERALFLGNRLGLLLDFPPPTHGPARERPQASFFGGLEPFRTLRDAIGGIEEDCPVLLDFSPRKKGYLAMVPPGGNWRALPIEVQQESMGKAWHAKGGRSGWWRRLSWDLPCPTIVTMPNHASTSMCHPDEIRVLSLKECSLIQEFPADWEFAGTVQQQYEQVGNAVPTRLGFVAGESIAQALDLASHGDERKLLMSRSAAAFSTPLRKVYLSSHVRTRQWYRGGEVFLWDDGSDKQTAEYRPGRRTRGMRH